MNPASPHDRPSRPRWLAYFYLLGAALLVFSLAGAGWVLRSHAGATPAQGTVEPAPANVVAVCLGHVDVEGGVIYPYPSQPGLVARVPVREGQHVDAGAVLFQMDDTIARAQLAEAEAALAAARAQLDEANTGPGDYELLLRQQTAARDAARHKVDAARDAAAAKKKLAEVKGAGVSQHDADAAEKLVKEAEAGLAAEEAKLDLLKRKKREIELKITLAKQDVAHKEALLNKARFALEQCTVKAPVAGRVLRMALHPGDRLGGEPKLPPMIFCPDGPRIVRAEVEQEWAGRVAEGQLASVQDETSSGGPTWTGKVVRLADWMAQRRSILPDPAQFHDIRTLECIIALDEGQPPLRIGQRVRVVLSNP